MARLTIKEYKQALTPVRRGVRTPLEIEYIFAEITEPEIPTTVIKTAPFERIFFAGTNVYSDQTIQFLEWRKMFIRCETIKDNPRKSCEQLIELKNERYLNELTPIG